MRSNVTLRGESKEKVILESSIRYNANSSTKKITTILMKALHNASLEDFYIGIQS